MTEVTGGPLAALAARHDMAELTVTAVDGLTDPDHPRAKRLVRLALPEGVDYRTADHLTVLPANDPALVERAARLLGADPENLCGTYLLITVCPLVLPVWHRIDGPSDAGASDAGPSDAGPSAQVPCRVPSNGRNDHVADRVRARDPPGRGRFVSASAADHLHDSRLPSDQTFVR